MVKLAKRQKPIKAFMVIVHSNSSPHILKAVCKGVSKVEAIDMARKLWKLSGSPYMSRVTDQDLNQVFFCKEKNQTFKTKLI